MPKLNTTIDNLEWKSNKVTAATPSASWTDTQYPSAKALYNAYNKLLNLQHPVGSVLITSTNTSPADTIGGTWTLIDKGFTSSHTNSGDYFTPSTNIVEKGTWVTRAGQTVRIRIAVTINTTATDSTGLVIGTVNYSKIGITRVHTDFVGHVSYSDGANCGITWYLNETTGELKIPDVFDLDTMASGNDFSIDMTFPVVYTQMVDSFCNKFYWKRTA